MTRGANGIAAPSDDEKAWLADFRRQYRSLVGHCRRLEQANAVLAARNADLERQLYALGCNQALQGEQAPDGAA